MINCFPFEDPVIVLKVTGKQIVEALENGVGSYPALEGRYPQVSNITFEADYSKPPMSRVSNVTIDEDPVDEGRVYVLATRGYMGRGKDGYTSLLIEEEGGTAKEIVSEENGVLISTILRQYFMSLKVLGKWKRWGKTMDKTFLNIQTNLEENHKHAFHEPSPTSPVDKKFPHHASLDRVAQQAQETSESESEDPDAEEDEDDGAEYDATRPITFNQREMDLLRKSLRKWWRLAKLEGSPKVCDELGQDEIQVNWTKAIAPRLEGRIKDITPAKA